jgi:hypothetical protein
MNENKSPKNIIWVEDDAFLGSILMKKFGATGHNVSLAKNDRRLSAGWRHASCY